METIYAQKNDAVQKASANTAESVVDSSSQSATLQRHAALANAAVQRAENPPRPNNTGLPDDLKNGIESLSGYSLDDVRVHYNSSKPATVQALAYTQGTDIHVAPGQEKHLPHEAWHVAQQMAGRVSPTTNINGMPVNDNASLEHEANVMGEKAVQCKCEKNIAQLKRLGNGDQPIQCGRAGDIVNNGGRRFTVLKINFAGSGYASWGNQNKGVQVFQISGHDILINIKGNNILEYSFPGPMSLNGALDASPSIDALVNGADEITNMTIHNRGPIHLIIKGHSRGAVAAGELYRRFVNNPNVINCELTMLDPVPGPDGRRLHGHGDTNLNMDANNTPVPQGLANVGKVVFYSLGIANQGLSYKLLFTPQRVQNACVYILTNDGHSCYVDSAAQIPIQNKKDRFDFNGLVFTYSQLSYLRNGYYFENGSYILNVRGVPIRIRILQQINRQQAINMVQNTNGLSKSRRDEITSSF